MNALRNALCGLALSTLLFAPAKAEPVDFQNLLSQGQVAVARDRLEQALKEHPEQHELRFELALTHFLVTLEGSSQSLFGFGIDTSSVGGFLRILRLSVEANPNPKPVSNKALRQVLLDLKNGLDRTSGILAEIPDSSKLKLPLKVGQIRLDLDGNGEYTEQESFARVLDRMTGMSPSTDVSQAKSLEGHFDVADVRWLEGYCHLASGILEIVLAYDTQRLFDHSAHMFFPRAETPYPFLTTGHGSEWELVDFAALVHTLNLPILDADGLKRSLNHFEQLTSLSRRSWKCIAAENDDDFEWLPGPGQHSIWQEATVTPEMVATWHFFLDEADLILAGKRLLPFWRNRNGRNPGEGVNLRQVFLKPTRLDAVYWLEGTAALPYLEEGTVTDERLWNELWRVFRGNFFGFAAWFN